MNILEVKGLNLAFRLEEGEAQAIHGVSFSLAKGKALGLVGESGCGKTVTAMSIMRLLPPNAKVLGGEILYNGQNVLGFSDKQMQKLRGAKVALIPQDPLTSLNPLYTVGEQIAETIKQHQNLSSSAAKQKAIEAMTSVQIPEAQERYNDYPHQFSGGMRQRIIIAMALSCNPELIIADEPTTALDVTVQAQILDLIKEIQKEYGTSLLLITHDLGVVAQVCDDVAVMYAGRIVEYANVREIFANPLHPYTKGLMESLPNINTERLKPIEGQPPSIREVIPGCPYYSRCKFRTDKCSSSAPSLTENKQGHYVSCFLYE